MNVIRTKPEKQLINSDNSKSWNLKISGLVQGVGFRPFLYRIANQLGLRGQTWNHGDSVIADIEGPLEALKKLEQTIKKEAPPAARIHEIKIKRDFTWRGFSGFNIIDSEVGEIGFAPSPDIGLCSQCQEELEDRDSRRHRYPFITCTQCGPRFTLLKDLPYTRENTSMRQFHLCEPCHSEFLSPQNILFNCETQSCPSCGPIVSYEPNLDSVRSVSGLKSSVGESAFDTAADLLLRGGILAIKGIGGFHLACVADDDWAIHRLRLKKQRQSKPLAIMAQESHLSRWFHVSPAEEALIKSAESPIVLLEVKNWNGISPLLSPGLNRVGVMRPYTPLHHLLLRKTGKPLVMTSGNFAGDPLVYQDAEAQLELGGLTDGFLVHNRPIEIPCDDSLAVVDENNTRYARRARGLTPKPVSLSSSSKPLLACGALLKHTFCLVNGNKAYLSQHLGDLEDEAVYLRFSELLHKWMSMLRIEPQYMACDLNKDYLSSQYAESSGLPIFRIQHHHAHVASVMAERGWNRPVLGVVFDGAGLGDDGTVWGGELLMADYLGYRRLHSLKQMPMPGGDLAAKESWRMAASYLHGLGGSKLAERHISQDALGAVIKQLEHSLNCPPTTSMGRLFDCAAALAGIDLNSYEGEAAARFEALADANAQGHYSMSHSFDAGISSADDLLLEMLSDLKKGERPESVSMRFHRGIARMVADLCVHYREQLGINRVVLSGGCFQNLMLSQLCRLYLEEASFSIAESREIPCNDGGLALGQAAIASALLAEGFHPESPHMEKI